MYNTVKDGDTMKRIGVIIPSITDDLQVELLDGIYKTASAADCDIIVLTTATNGMEFHIQNEIMTGEESIYLLLERAELDGILLISQYFVKATVRKTLSEIIRSTAIPCIDLGGTELGFETVFIPNCSDPGYDKAPLYVALTRTYSSLYIMYTGQKPYFISQIPSELYEANNDGPHRKFTFGNKNTSNSTESPF